MGDAQAPGGYFTGRPVNYEDKPQDPAPDVQSKETAPAGTGYFTGRPANYEDKSQDPAPDVQSKETAPAGTKNVGEQQGQAQAPATAGQKKTGGCLGNLFCCFSGGRADS